MCHLVWRSHTFSTGSAIESDHSCRFMSIGQYAFTAEESLSPGSVTTFHILLPHVRTWVALKSLRVQDSLPLNLSLRLEGKEMWHCPWNWNNLLLNQSKWYLMCMTPTNAEFSMCINSRYSCNFLIHSISIFHCLLMSLRVNVLRFYLEQQEPQISGILSM